MLTCLMVVTCFAKDTVKIYTSQPPGGTADSLIRKIQKVTADSDFNIVVMNKPGADGIVALREFLNDKTGHPLLLTGTVLAMKSVENEAYIEMYKNLVPLVYMTDIHTIFVVSKKSKITSWEDLIAESKRRPVTIGASSNVQKFIVDMMIADNTNILVVPFSGDSPTLTTLLSESIDVANLTAGTAVNHIQSGTVNGIAATHQNTASVPVLSSSGKINLIATGLFVKTSTPYDVRQRYQKLFTEIVSSKEIIEFYKQNNLLFPKDNSGAALENHMKAVQNRMSKNNDNHSNR
jgi:tripartite-type tricarboxylate transporter receptor subunit TctC